MLDRDGGPQVAQRAGEAAAQPAARGGSGLRALVGRGAVLAGRRLLRWLLKLVVAIGLSAFIFLLLLPPVALAAVGVWAAISNVQALRHVIEQLANFQVAGALQDVQTIDIASRLALLSGGYFAVFLALVVLLGGLLGIRWRRLFIVPGVPLVMGGLAALILGVQLSYPTAVRAGWNPAAQIPLTLYLLLDALALAALLTDARPSSRRAHRARATTRRRVSSTPVRVPGAEAEPTPALRVVRFGPSTPLTMPLTTPDAHPREEVTRPDDETLSLPALRPHGDV